MSQRYKVTVDITVTDIGKLRAKALSCALAKGMTLSEFQLVEERYYSQNPAAYWLRWAYDQKDLTQDCGFVVEDSHAESYE